MITRALALALGGVRGMQPRTLLWSLRLSPASPVSVVPAFGNGIKPIGRSWADVT